VAYFAWAGEIAGRFHSALQSDRLEEGSERRSAWYLGNTFKRK
jgi:Ser/Thr protein kinase RdoA (MazF antagonist)